MSQLSRIPALIQIFFAEFIVLLFLSSGAIELVRLVFRPASGILPRAIDWTDGIFWLIGALCLYWLMRTIWRPVVTGGRWVPVHWAGPVPVGNPSAAIDYTFASTHPSYVFVDALAVGVGAFIYVAWASAWEERRIEGIVVLALALLTPAARLLAWYVFGLRPRARAPGEAASAAAARVTGEAWRPVAAFYAVMVPILAIAGIAGWILVARDERARLDSAVRLEPAMFEGRAFVEIRDRSVGWVEQTRVARFAVVPGEAIRRCVHADDKNRVTIHRAAAFGAVPRLVLVLDPEHDAALARRAAQRPGAPVELLAVVMRPPAAVPAWRRNMWCGFAAEGMPRWIVEVERVLPEGAK